MKIVPYLDAIVATRAFKEDTHTFECVCGLAFNQNVQTGAQVIKFLLLQMGCSVVMSYMVKEEHVNEVTCSGPTKAEIISAPIKETKHEVILLT